MDTTLTIDQVSLSRGERCLFTGLSASLHGGELAVVVGPNGAGKSSLLRLLAGFLMPAEGRVSIDGEPVARLVRENRAPIHYHGHQDGLKRDLSVAENLAVYARLWRVPAHLEQVLAPLRMAEHQHRLPRQLSAGQRRRTALALLRLCPSRIWLLDEPFTNLDVDGRAVIEQWLAEHLQGGGIAVVATHQPLALTVRRQLSIEL